MRANYIKLTAFGSYAHTQELNLDELGEKGVFVIHGDTGAGKTTLFDAITYALYGEPSGSSRKSADVRSLGADPNIRTEVMLEFTYAGQKYRIIRKAPHERLSTRKNKAGLYDTITVGPEAELYWIGPDGQVQTDHSVIQKVDAVTSKVTEILGVNQDQFMQIAMIAQGDFRKLIDGSTKDREGLYRTIFQTGRYKQLQDEVKRDFSAISDQSKKAIQDIRDQVLLVELAADDQAAADLRSEIAKGLRPHSEAEGFLKGLIDTDGKAFDSAKALWEEWDNKVNKLQNNAGNLDTAWGYQKQILSAKAARKKKEEEDKPRCEKELADATEQQPRINALKKEETLLSASLSKYEERDKADQSAKEWSEKEDAARRKKEKADQEEKRLQIEKEKLETEQSSLAHAGEKIVTLENEKTGLETKMKDLGTLLEKIKEYHRIDRIYQDHNNNLKDLVQENDRLQGEYNAALHAFLSNQAGILAENLSDGIPCPVCGSVHHPTPAIKPADAPSEEKVQQLKKMADKAATDAADMSRECGKDHIALNSLLDNVIQPMIGKYPQYELSIENGQERISIIQKELSGQIDAKRKEIEAEKGNKARKDAITDKLLPACNQALEGQQQIKKDEGQNEVEAKAKKEASQQKVTDLSKDLTFESKEKAEERIKTVQNDYQNLESAIETAKKNLADIGTKISELDSSVKTNQDNLDALIRQHEDLSGLLSDLTENLYQERKQDIQESIQTASTERGKAGTRRDTILRRKSQNEKTLERIQRLATDLKTIEAKQTWLKPLNDTLSGTGTDKGKVTFESFVLATVLDRIIARANLRFKEMTAHHLELVRREESTDGRAKSGLDLDIIDHFSGDDKCRKASSLSGGESFMASLSMALGLADEIQSAAGGVKLDSLFVDEGFGSLSDEALAQAKRVLLGLSEEGSGRIVGIISHIQDLQKWTDRRIYVQKDKDGNSVATLE
jgi:exonuclease SbcC